MWQGEEEMREELFFWSFHCKPETAFPFLSLGKLEAPRLGSCSQTLPKSLVSPCRNIILSFEVDSLWVSDAKLKKTFR